MNQSESIDQLAAALALVQAEIEQPKKTATNPHFRNKYAPLGEVLRVALACLPKHGLSISQGCAPVAGQYVNVTTTMMHKSGQWCRHECVMPLEKATAQAVGSAMTYGRRYGLEAILGLDGQDDDDGEHASAPPPAPALPPGLGIPAGLKKTDPALRGPVTPPAPPADGGVVPNCPVCQGPMWDNRERRAQQQAEYEAGTRKSKPGPAFSCKNKECKGAIWSSTDGVAAAGKPEAPPPAPPAPPAPMSAKDQIAAAFEATMAEAMRVMRTTREEMEERLHQHGVNGMAAATDALRKWIDEDLPF